MTDSPSLSTSKNPFFLSSKAHLFLNCEGTADTFCNNSVASESTKTEVAVSGVTNCLGLPKIEEFLRKLALPSAKTGNILASLEGDAQRICDRKEMYTLPC